MLLSKIKYSFTIIKCDQLKYLKPKIIKSKKSFILISPQNLIFNLNLNKWNYNYLIPLNYYNQSYFNMERLIKSVVNQKFNKTKLVSKKIMTETQLLSLL